MSAPQIGLGGGLAHSAVASAPLNAPLSAPATTPDPPQYAAHVRIDCDPVAECAGSDLSSSMDYGSSDAWCADDVGGRDAQAHVDPSAELPGIGAGNVGQVRDGLAGGEQEQQQDGERAHGVDVATSGPWWVGQHDGSRHLRICGHVRTNDGTPKDSRDYYAAIGSVHQRDPHPVYGGGITMAEMLANGRMMAAAPLMLEALQAQEEVEVLRRRLDRLRDITVEPFLLTKAESVECLHLPELIIAANRRAHELRRAAIAAATGPRS